MRLDGVGQAKKPAGVHYDGAKLIWADRRVHTRDMVIGEVRYEPGGFCGPRVQRDFELVVFHAGGAQVRIGETTRGLAVGHVYLFLPGCREHFRFDSERETHHSYCSANPRFVPRPLADQLRKAPAAVPQSEVFRLLLGAAFKLRPPRNAATHRLINQLGLCLFQEYLHAADEVELHRSGDRAVGSFLAYLEDHFGDEDCLEAAQRAAGVSPNALIYKLRRELNLTPGRFLWKTRVERGVAMLAETGYTVAEIAFRCGFKSPFHFSRLVRQHAGQAPRLLRRDAWTRVRE
jgi:AraC family transcriptional regulator of arabinose operon